METTENNVEHLAASHEIVPTEPAGSISDIAAFMDALVDDTKKIGLPLEERITSQMCMVCSQHIKHGQVVSGIRLSKGAEEIVGHYACIVKMLGSERTLQAILAQRLPAINILTLVDGRVPGWEKLFDVG